MPSNDELCLLFGVTHFLSDPITLDDLASAKKTRKAIHRELIRRRPGVYPRRWLAKRLGVSCETLDTYNRQIEGLHSRHCFWEQRIYWWNLNSVPDGIEVNGGFLVDETGKRYPAKRKMAAILLGKGSSVIYKRQDANYYWFGETMPDIGAKLDLRPQWRDKESQKLPVQPIIRQVETPKPQLAPIVASNKGIQSPPIVDIPLRPKASQSPEHQEPLSESDQEALAIRVYEVLNAQATDPTQRISQVNARKMVNLYGSQAVKTTLAIMAKRTNIYHPVGFFITYLRSESKRHRLVNA